MEHSFVLVVSDSPAVINDYRSKYESRAGITLIIVPEWDNMKGMENIAKHTGRFKDVVFGNGLLHGESSVYLLLKNRLKAYLQSLPSLPLRQNQKAA